MKVDCASVDTRFSLTQRCASPLFLPSLSDPAMSSSNALAPLLLAGVLLATSIAAQDEGCYNNAWCSACTNDPAGNCGWCASTMVCHRGSSSGPTHGNCSDWEWLPSECPTPAPTTAIPSSVHCEQYTDCFSCTQSLPRDCGWCSQASRCMKGNQYEPYNYTWNCYPWAFSPDYCLPTPNPTHTDCSRWTNCHDCTTSPSTNCGWCSDLNQCYAGTGEGPNNGACSVHWDWGLMNCPTPVPAGTVQPMPPAPPSTACGRHTTCYSCTMDPSGTCGYCVADKTCSAGTASGPTLGTCTAGWEWESGECSGAAGVGTKGGAKSAAKRI